MANSVEDAIQVLRDNGFTAYDLLQIFGESRADLFRLPAEAQKQFDEYYDILVKKDYTVHTKGKLLEKLTTALFCEKMFTVRQNCQTSTNEIDILLDWSTFARENDLHRAYPCFGDLLLCECKNYDRAVSVTYIGKFASLLISSHADIGIMIAWEGVSGSGWNDGCGLIKKLALANQCTIIVLDKHDLEQVRNKSKTICSIVHDKHVALITDIDYAKYIKRHEAQDKWMLS